jgi:hypothetical protein
MKNLSAIVSALLWVGIAGAQGVAQDRLQVHVPQEDDVLAKTLSADSPYFYRPMLTRYLAGDTTLTDDHYFYLYYGWAYEQGYDPRGPLPGEEAIAAILVRRGEAALQPPTRDEALAILEAARLNMVVDPFSPSNINLMTFACELAGDTLGARINADRYRKIVRAITSSGTGARERSPWHILRYSHADDIIEAQGLKIINRQVRARDVEYIQVERNSKGVDGYFFNFGRIYAVEPR